MTEHVRIFDTTLRDGEQSPGATMTLEEKIRMARRLDAMGVDVIEAGFPVASPGELDAVRTVASAVERAEIAALCRTRAGDIQAAWEAVRHAAKPRLHVFIATSDIHLEHKLRMTRAQVLGEVRRGVAMCREVCDVVEFSAEDATRTDLDFLCDVFAVAAEMGATVVNVPDTVGYTMPTEYDRIIRRVVQTVGPDVVVSAHCHNDLGLAVANSLAAIAAGARQIEGCINGIGERAGNAAIEEVVMALRTRRDLMGVTTHLDTTQLLAASRMVSEITGLAVQPNKAVVGRNAFAHEAGIHQHGVLNHTETYEIMKPEDVGWTASNLVLGKHSGKHALRSRLQELGFDPSDSEMTIVFDRFKRLCDRKKDIYEEDLYALVARGDGGPAAIVALDALTFHSGVDVEPEATATVTVHGETATVTSTGDGPIHAALEAIRQAADVDDVTVEQFHADAITRGSDAMGKVNVRVRRAGVAAHGQSTHTDTVVAAAQAFVDALNHLLFLEGRIESFRTAGVRAMAGGAA